MKMIVEPELQYTFLRPPTTLLLTRTVEPYTNNNQEIVNEVLHIFLNMNWYSYFSTSWHDLKIWV